jgi:hypothetical protein
MHLIQKINDSFKYFDRTLAQADTVINSIMSSSMLPRVLLFLLLAVNFITVVIFDGFSTIYNFDEYVVTIVGLQDFSQFWDTLHSEPHPPGFYLLIKFMSQLFAPPLSLKLAFKTLTTSLYLISLLYFLRQKDTLRKLNLEWGIVLVLLAGNFLTMMSNLKQDIISAPLYLLLFFMALTQVVSKQYSFKKELSIALLLTTLFFIGYLNYFFGLLWVLSCRAINYKEVLGSLKQSWKSKVPIWFAHFSVITVYLWMFGIEQWQINQTRFTWVSHQSNSLLHSFSLHLSLLVPGEILSDICLISILFLISFALYKREQLFKMHDEALKRVFFLFCAAAGLLLLICYFGKFFSQTRYAFPLFIILSILAGWGITLFKKKVVILAILLFLLGIKTAVYSIANEMINAGFIAMMENIAAHTKEKKYGFVSSSPSGALYFKLQFFRDNPNIVPINPSYPRLYDINTFGRDQLLYIDVVMQQPLDHTKQIFKEYGLTDFMYLNFHDQLYHDPEEKVMNVLAQSCVFDSIEPVKYTNLRIYYFSECRFD